MLGACAAPNCPKLNEWTARGRETRLRNAARHSVNLIRINSESSSAFLTLASKAKWGGMSVTPTPSPKLCIGLACEQTLAPAIFVFGGGL